MSTNLHWTKNEDMKILFEIINRELIKKTQFNTNKRKILIDKIANDLLQDPDFLARLKTDKPSRTIAQHIRVWIAYLEDRRNKKPPQKY